MGKKQVTYPECERRPLKEIYFGVTVSDDYRWLEDAGDPKVMDWVSRENALTDSWFDQERVSKKAKELQAQSPKERIQTLMACGDGWIGTASVDNPMSTAYAFYADQTLEQKDVIFSQGQIPHLQPAFLAQPSFLFNNLVMIKTQEDDQQAESAVIVDRNTKEVLAVLRSIWTGGWSVTQPVFYYARTYYNRQTGCTELKILGYNVPEKKERVVYEEFCHCGSARAYGMMGKILVEIADDFANNRYIEIDETTGDVFRLNQETAPVNFLTVAGDEYYFISKEQSNEGAVIAVGPGKSLDEARVIREETDDVIDGGFILKGVLYLTARRSGEPILLKADPVAGDSLVELPDRPATAIFAGIFGMDAVLLNFMSYRMSSVFLKFDGETFETIYGTDLKEYKDMVVEQRWVPSIADGEKIPYYICHGRDIKMDGSHPAQLTGYGGYNNLGNYFSSPAYQDIVTGTIIGEWVEKGGIYVSACVRGGGEFGRRWHEGGMRENKKNCFADFISVAEALIADGWTSPGKLCVNGESNGGLLVSAALNARPDLFGCAIIGIPHTDMIRFRNDDNGPRYTPEYGDPLENPEMLEYMLSYSPVHNVKKTAYPPIYLFLGEVDDNVPPYHGKKLTALLQASTTSQNPVLLRTNPDSGHGLGTGEAYWRTFAEIQLFIEQNLGME